MHPSVAAKRFIEILNEYFHIQKRYVLEGSDKDKAKFKRLCEGKDKS